MLCPALHLAANDQGVQAAAQGIGADLSSVLVLWENDGITVGDISKRLLTDPGSLTPLLKRLEAEGLLKRQRSKQDERVVELHLTDAGHALKEQAKAVPRCIVDAADQSLDELVTLRDQLLKLRTSLQRSLEG